MLENIDVEEIGREWTTRQRAKIAKALRSENEDEEATNARIALADELLRKANATDIAREVLDVSLFAGASAAVDREFADVPRVAASLRFSLGHVYSGLGIYDASMAQFERAYEFQSVALGKDDPETLASLAAIANLTSTQGRVDEAIPLSKEALAGRRRVLGNNHPDTIASLIDTGYMFKKAGDLVEAEKIGSKRPNVLEQFQIRLDELGYDPEEEARRSEERV